MSGHSKWSTIKRKKGATDAKRSNIFSRLVKEITVAVKEGGAEIESNSRLRLAVQNAKGANMPKENIMRAIHKAEKEDARMEELTFEGYLSGGIGVFIECLSDNNNRTVSQVRMVFNKKDGTMGTKGSLNFMFERKGVFTFEKKDDLNMDDIELELIDSGAEEIVVEDGKIIVTTALGDFGPVNKKLEKLKIEVESADLERIATNTKKMSLEESQKVLNVIEAFEELEDVQNVYHNLEMTEQLQTFLEKNN